jgi:NAD(P)-dependent dehydrogenase (short-subunit alcohol dehydrogenase family)
MTQNSSLNSHQSPDHRVALITGAASGIGRQLAINLANEGWAIGGIDLNADPLAKLANELSNKPLATEVADVTDRRALEAAVARLEERLGPTEMVVASAGIGVETSALVSCADDIERTIRINLIGVSNTLMAVVPGMRRRRKGHLVAISSMASYRGIPRMAGYCASKAGVNALMDALRVELKPLGIVATTICPGWIKTPMTAELQGEMPGLMSVEDAARYILRAVREKRPFYAFPPALVRRSRMLRYLPIRASDWILSRMMPALPEFKDKKQ